MIVEGACWSLRTTNFASDKDLGLRNVVLEDIIIGR